jgi:hypothetical protein
MDIQPLSLPPEFRQALEASGGLPLYFEDPETHERFVLQQGPVEITLDEEYIAKCLDEGLADIEAGRVVPWDPERIKELGRQRLAERKAKR